MVPVGHKLFFHCYTSFIHLLDTNLTYCTMSTLGLAGFVRLTLLAKNLFSSSSSTGEPTGAAQELIEGLVPDYRYVHSIIPRLTGMNATSIVTLIIVCLFVIGLVKPCWSEVDRFLVSYFTSAVVVPATGRAAQDVLQFQIEAFCERRGPRSLTPNQKDFHKTWICAIGTRYAIMVSPT